MGFYIFLGTVDRLDEQAATPWTALRREWRIWKAGALPGLAVIGLVALLRLTGSLQMLELLALDALLRLRPAEPPTPIS